MYILASLIFGVDERMSGRDESLIEEAKTHGADDFK